jgi:hypothetical protein
MILYHFFGRDRGYDIISSKKGYVQCLSNLDIITTGNLLKGLPKNYFHLRIEKQTSHVRSTCGITYYVYFTENKMVHMLRTWLVCWSLSMMCRANQPTTPMTFYCFMWRHSRGHQYQFYFDIISYQYHGPKSDILSCKYHFQKSDMW